MMILLFLNTTFSHISISSSLSGSETICHGSDETICHGLLLLNAHVIVEAAIGKAKLKNPIMLLFIVRDWQDMYLKVRARV